MEIYLQNNLKNKNLNNSNLNVNDNKFNQKTKHNQILGFINKKGSFPIAIFEKNNNPLASNLSNKKHKIKLNKNIKKNKINSKNKRAKTEKKNKTSTKIKGPNLAPIKSKKPKRINSYRSIDENYEEEENSNEEDNNDNEEEEDNEEKTNKKNYTYKFFRFKDSKNLYIFLQNSKYYIESNHNEYFDIISNINVPFEYTIRINKFGNMPQCIIDSCKNNGIIFKKKFENCNIIWKLFHPNKMRDLIRNLNKKQKFNHFPSTYQLGRKDNMYRHFRHFNRLFPNDYKFVPLTFILPFDGEKFELEYKSSKKSKIKWIVKPVNMSRGRGVHLLKDEEEFKEINKKSEKLNISQYLVSKYISNPHTLNNKKYDLRIYVLITSFTPLKIYLYYNGLVRFATENYEKNNFDNIYIHLTNYSINKNNLKYKINENKNDNIEENKEDDSSKWSLIEYKNHFYKTGQYIIFNKIWRQIQDIVIKTIISTAYDNAKEITYNKIFSMFELYGFDIMIDENFKAWLIEVNVNPSLHCTSPLDLSIKTDLISDIFNILGLEPYSHQLNSRVFKLEEDKEKENKKIDNIFNLKNNNINKENNNNIQLPKINKKQDINIKNNNISYQNNNNIFPYLNSSNNQNKNNNFFMNNQNNILNNNQNNNQIINQNNNNNNLNNNQNNNNIIGIKSGIIKKFIENGYDYRIKQEIFDHPYYINIKDNFIEERCRSEVTGFKLIFPLNSNIDIYSKYLIKEGINDTNLFIWQYLLNEDNY